MRYVRTLTARSGALSRAAAVVLLAVSPSTAIAQRVAGVVVDSTGRAIVQADVIVGPSLRTRTDSTGAFEIAVNARGSQRLRVRFIGYRPYEATVDPAKPGSASLRIKLTRMPQLLAEVRITDINSCERNTIRGFECRRASGQGVFRDAGEIRAMRPSAWADMLDGIPSLRRTPVMTPDGLDYRPAAPPSTCLVEIYNGEDPRFDGHVRKVPVLELVTRDVIAIEYYETYAQIPDALKRFAFPRVDTDVGTEASASPTPMPAARPCSMIVYWLREAPSRQRPVRGSSREPIVIRRP